MLSDFVFSEDRFCGLMMEISSVMKYFEHGLVPREACEDPELDLRVVSDDIRPAFIFWMESAFDLVTQFIAGGYILEIGIVG